jgi:hypothetical protein
VPFFFSYPIKSFITILNVSKLTKEQRHDQLKRLYQTKGKSIQEMHMDEQKATMKAAKVKMKAE